MAEDKIPSAPPVIDDTSVPRNIDQIVRDKKNPAFDWMSSAHYGVALGGTNLLAQAMVEPLVKRGAISDILKNEESRLAYEALTTDAAKNTMVIEHLEKESKTLFTKTLTHMAKNPIAWTSAMTVAGVGAVLGWEWWEHASRKSETAKEIADLLELKKTWVERTAAIPSAGLQKS